MAENGDVGNGHATMFDRFTHLCKISPKSQHKELLKLLFDLLFDIWSEKYMNMELERAC